MNSGKVRAAPRLALDEVYSVEEFVEMVKRTFKTMLSTVTSYY
jgi:hypothetical protein